MKLLFIILSFFIILSSSSRSYAVSCSEVYHDTWKKRTAFAFVPVVGWGVGILDSGFTNKLRNNVAVFKAAHILQNESDHTEVEKAKARKKVQKVYDYLVREFRETHLTLEMLSTVLADYDNTAVEIGECVKPHLVGGYVKSITEIMADGLRDSQITLEDWYNGLKEQYDLKREREESAERARDEANESFLSGE